MSKIIGRPRRHLNNAEKQRAYRERLKTKSVVTVNGDKVNARNKRARFNQRNPDKVKAWNALNHAVAIGKIVRGSCEVCGTSADVHGHHDDYARPLDVRWLCHDCHVAHHRAMTREYPW